MAFSRVVLDASMTIPPRTLQLPDYDTTDSGPVQRLRIATRVTR